MRNNYNEQLIRFEAEGVRVNFACYTRGNRSGFVHEVTMYEEGRGYATASESVQYYNRTWEEYTYQSVMGSIVYGLERRELERIRRVWMSERGYERMTAKRRAEFEADDTETPRLRFLRTLSFCIHGMPRPWHSCAGERERANRVAQRDLASVARGVALVVKEEREPVALGLVVEVAVGPAGVDVGGIVRQREGQLPAAPHARDAHGELLRQAVGKRAGGGGAVQLHRHRNLAYPQLNPHVRLP